MKDDLLLREFQNVKKVGFQWPQTWHGWLLVFHKLLIHWVSISRLYRGWSQKGLSSTCVKQNALLMSEDRLAGDHRKATDCTSELVSHGPPQLDSNWIKPFVQSCTQICPRLLCRKRGCAHPTEGVPREYSCPVFTNFHGLWYFHPMNVVRVPAEEASLPRLNRIDAFSLVGSGRLRPLYPGSLVMQRRTCHASCDGVRLRLYFGSLPLSLARPRVAST